jgi:hypothetical protein
MKNLPSILIFLLLTACASFTSQVSSPFVGHYEGRWKSQDGSGKLVLNITQLNNSQPTADVNFNYEGIPIHAKTEELTIKDNQITILISWDVQSTHGTTKLLGTLVDKQISGTLSNNPELNTTDGTWTVKIK